MWWEHDGHHRILTYPYKIQAGKLQKVWNAPKFLTNEHSNFSNVWFLLIHLHPSSKPVCQISRIWAAWGLLFLNLATATPTSSTICHFQWWWGNQWWQGVSQGENDHVPIFLPHFFPKQFTTRQLLSGAAAIHRIETSGQCHPQKCEICCSDPKNMSRTCVYNSHEFATTLGRILLFHLFWGIALLFAGLVASGNENAIRPILAVNVRSRPSSATRDSLPLYPGNDCNTSTSNLSKLQGTKATCSRRTTKTWSQPPTNLPAMNKRGTVRAPVIFSM